MHMGHRLAIPMTSTDHRREPFYPSVACMASRGLAWPSWLRSSGNTLGGIVVTDEEPYGQRVCLIVVDPRKLHASRIIRESRPRVAKLSPFGSAGSRI